MNSDSLQKSIQTFSLVVNSALDCLGYSKEQVARRADMVAKNHGEKMDIFNLFKGWKLDVIAAGSRGEGVPYKSDHDVLMVQRSAICVEDGHDEDGLVVFISDVSDSPPGYTKLFVRRIQIDKNLLHVIFINSTTHKIVSGKNLTYLSSLRYRNALCIGFASAQSFQNYISFPERDSNGPAFTFTMSLHNPFIHFTSSLETDIVPALPAYMPSALYNWKNRRRDFGWPSTSLVKDVAATEVILVPTGPKESKEANLEWRICFPEGEKRLILDMNESQIKVYVLFKMLKKDIIGKTFLVYHLTC